MPCEGLEASQVTLTDFSSGRVHYADWVMGMTRPIAGLLAGSSPLVLNDGSLFCATGTSDDGRTPLERLDNLELSVLHEPRHDGSRNLFVDASGAGYAGEVRVLLHLSIGALHHREWGVGRCRSRCRRAHLDQRRPGRQRRGRARVVPVTWRARSVAAAYTPRDTRCNAQGLDDRVWVLYTSRCTEAIYGDLRSPAGGPD